jgi:tRNA threonylcarbamoyl adenosine modification protein YeaZ
MTRYVLGIDTSGRNGSIALALDGRAVASEPLAPGGHSSGLSAAAERLLAARGIAWKDLAGVAVSEGPGSFTGLRIGLAWAKGLCMGSGFPLVLVSEHDAAAYAHKEEGGLIATVLQGERGEAVAALWSVDGELIRTWGPRSVPEPELPSALREAAGGRGFRIVDQDSSAPRAAAVAELGNAKLLAGESADLVSAAPAYGRSPNARKPGS